MSEQASLLSDITTAHSLMHRIVSLQQRISQLTRQIVPQEAKSNKRHPVRYAICCFLAAFYLITSTPFKWVTYVAILPVIITLEHDLQLSIYNTVNIVLSVIVGAIFYKIIAMVADKRRAEKNVKIEESNQALTQSIEQIKQEILPLQQRWASEVAPWYPMDYDSTDAVDFFLSAVRNHRAATVQEMVNLYETELHQRRMEQGQQDIANQQRIGNMLQVGNLVMQGQILDQTRQANANAASASDSLNWITRKMGR